MPTFTNFDDNFSSYTPGSTNFNGWINNFQGIGQAGTCVDFSTMTGSSSATGFFEREGKGAFLPNVAIIFQDTTNTQVSVTQVVWAGWSNSNNVPTIYVDNVNLSTGTSSNPTQFSNLGRVVVNSDYTMSFVVPSTQTGGSIYGGAVYVQTTENQVVYPYTWQYFQCLFETSAITLLGTTYAQVACELAVNGTVVLNTSAVTNINVISLYTAPNPFVNQWRFQGGGGYIGDITSFIANTTATVPPITTWPHPGTPLQANITQGVVEVMANANRAARITQGVVEIPQMPSSRYARMTQGVVEIVWRSTPPVGWYVWEA